MDEKYGKLNEKFREKVKQLILSKMKKTTESKVLQILEEYKKYYENLLKTRQSETAGETQIQWQLEKEFQQITNRKGDKKESITEIIIRKAIRRMKI